MMPRIDVTRALDAVSRTDRTTAEGVARLITWLEGYVTAAHGKDANVPYFNSIRRVLRAKERELRSNEAANE